MAAGLGVSACAVALDTCKGARVGESGSLVCVMFRGRSGSMHDSNSAYGHAVVCSGVAHMHAVPGVGFAACSETVV